MIPLNIILFYDLRFADDPAKVDVDYQSLFFPIAVTLLTIGVGTEMMRQQLIIIKKNKTVIKSISECVAINEFIIFLCLLTSR